MMTLIVVTIIAALSTVLGGGLSKFDPRLCTFDQFIGVVSKVPIEEMLIYGKDSLVDGLLENPNLQVFWETWIPKTLQLPCSVLERMYPSMILQSRHHADDRDDIVKCIFSYQETANPERQEIWRMLRALLAAPMPERAIQYVEFLDRLYDNLGHFDQDDPFLSRLDLFIAGMTAPPRRIFEIDNLLAPLPAASISGLSLLVSVDVEVEEVAKEMTPHLLIALENEDVSFIKEVLNALPYASLRFLTPAMRERLSIVYSPSWEAEVPKGPK